MNFTGVLREVAQEQHVYSPFFQLDTFLHALHAFHWLSFCCINKYKVDVLKFCYWFGIPYFMHTFLKSLVECIFLQLIIIPTEAKPVWSMNSHFVAFFVATVTLLITYCNKIFVLIFCCLISLVDSPCGKDSFVILVHFLMSPLSSLLVCYLGA